MKISKYQPDKENLIYIPSCVQLLNMGLQDNIVTIWAVSNPLKKEALSLSFLVKADGEVVTEDNLAHYISSFISDKGIWHLFGQEPESRTK